MLGQPPAHSMCASTSQVPSGVGSFTRGSIVLEPSLVGGQVPGPGPGEFSSSPSPILWQRRSSPAMLPQQPNMPNTDGGFLLPQEQSGSRLQWRSLPIPGSGPTQAGGLSNGGRDGQQGSGSAGGKSTNSGQHHFTAPIDPWASPVAVAPETARMMVNDAASEPPESPL